MSHYKYHVFFCTNQRTDGRQSCQDHSAAEQRDYLKRRCEVLGLAGPDGVRINTAGCMDRCELGPVIAVYPEAVWYTYVDEEDIEEILQKHLISGQVVERLKI